MSLKPWYKVVTPRDDLNKKRTKDGLPAHSFRTLLKDLATICKNRIQPRLPGAPAFDKITLPTPGQHTALKLLRVRL